MNTQFLAYAGGRIAYDDTGEGPLIVCIPAMGDLRSEYRHLTPRLVAAGYRVVTFDLRGLGESSTGWPEVGSLPTAHDLIALVRHLDAGPALVYGCSLGAASAVWASAQQPELFRGLVLAGPFVRDAPTTLITQIGTVLMRAPGVLRPAFLAYFPKWEPNPPTDFAAHLERLRANLREPGRVAALRGYFRMSHRASAERLGEVRTPSLVIMGTADVDFPDPAAEARWIADQLGSELLLVEGAGHHPQVEFPERIAEAVVAFDSKLPA